MALRVACWFIGCLLYVIATLLCRLGEAPPAAYGVFTAIALVCATIFVCNQLAYLQQVLLDLEHAHQSLTEAYRKLYPAKSDAAFAFPVMMGHKTSVPTTATYRVSEIQKGLV